MRFSIRGATTIVAAASGLLLATVGPVRAAGPPGTGAVTGYATELAPADDGMPPGVVNGPCTPSAEHPYPVVLVHGTSANENMSWQTLAPALAGAGYCVFGLNYGATASSYKHSYGLDFVEHSAQQLRAFIETTALPDTLEPANNAAGYTAGSHPAQVDIVGHSQGGMMPRYLIDTTMNPAYPGLGAAGEVHTLVGLAPSNEGTTAGGLVTLGQAVASAFGQPDAPYQFGSSGGCGACGEQEAGSPFLRALNGQPDAAGVAYYVIETDHDQVVTPYTNAFLPGGENVQNITLQDQCATDGTDHLGIIYDPVAQQDVMAALADNSTTADPLPQPVCPVVVVPVISG